MATTKDAQQVRQALTVAGSLAVVVAIVWIDIATGVWQEVVILSGLAAGLVTFILTVVVLQRLTARATARRWAPINRLAITEFLHAIVDESASEVAHGKFVPRSLTMPAEIHSESLAELRQQVVGERRALSDALSRWTSFLASSGDNEEILLHIANIALHLDLVRDAALESELHKDNKSTTALASAVNSCNDHLEALVSELQGRLQLLPAGL